MYLSVDYHCLVVREDKAFFGIRSIPYFSVRKAGHIEYRIYLSQSVCFAKCAVALCLGMHQTTPAEDTKVAELICQRSAKSKTYYEILANPQWPYSDAYRK